MNKPQLSPLDLREFEKQTLPFYEHKTLRDGFKVKSFNFNNFMRAKGAMRYDGIYWTICALNLFMELDEKLQQLGKHRGKIAYAKRKEAEELEKAI